MGYPLDRTLAEALTDLHDSIRRAERHLNDEDHTDEEDAWWKGFISGQRAALVTMETINV